MHQDPKLCLPPHLEDGKSTTENPITESEIKQIRDTFHEPDISLIKSVIYFDGWSDWEECGGVLIFRGIDDSIQLVRYGYCVMASDNTNYWELEEIDLETAQSEIDEIEK